MKREAHRQEVKRRARAGLLIAPALLGEHADCGISAFVFLHESLYCSMHYNSCGPLLQEKPVTAVAVVARLPKVFKKTKTILIADDNEMVRTILRRTLERETNYQVCGEATDGTEAVSKAKELEPDLVILDVRMPGLNGMEVAGILRYALPKVRIIFVTMYAEDITDNLTSVFHIDAVISKASGLTRLLEHVESVLVEPLS
jgi:CheY-like chemotaxis protein